MPEINLPTKATQDLIKQDTADILSQFPISGGTDWSKLTPAFSYTSTAASASSSAGTLLDITGKGILTGVYIRGGVTNSSNNIRITIDGVVVGGWINSYGAAGDAVPITYKFNQSLKVEGYSSNNLYVGVSYNLI
ncbi:hypothetical protein [Cytobacillus sp.]|uniref:hypothetical protein n=1 Tax=Cytobacillus sp. TaxID=2675269 RepID=UPI003517FE47